MTHSIFVQRAILNQYPVFDFNVLEETDEMVKCQPRRNINVLLLVKILHPLMSRPIRFCDLHRVSQIRYKRQFLDHLDFCQQVGFIKTEKVKKFDYYAITDKGRILMELF